MLKEKAKEREQEVEIGEVETEGIETEDMKKDAGECSQGVLGGKRRFDGTTTTN